MYIKNERFFSITVYPGLPQSDSSRYFKSRLSTFGNQTESLRDCASSNPIRSGPEKFDRALVTHDTLFRLSGERSTLVQAHRDSVAKLGSSVRRSLSDIV